MCQYGCLSLCSDVQMSTLPISADAAIVQALADTFRILGDPTRVRIVDALADGEEEADDNLDGVPEEAEA